MKRIVILLLLTATFLTYANAQNIFPKRGNAGIGTLQPDAPLTILPLGKFHPGSGYSRIRLKNYNSNYNGRYWDISAFIANGTNSDDKLNIYNKGKGNLLTITGNGNVGIGINNPTNPLSFPPVMGKKISLFPGNTGDAGFSVTDNRLLIHADNPTADVAIGFDAAGAFNERIAFKASGAIAVNSNTGSPGQVLVSNGPGSAPQWKTPTMPIFQQNSNCNCGGGVMITPLIIPPNSTRIISKSLFRVDGVNAQVLVNYQLLVGSGAACILCGETGGFVNVLLDGNATPVSGIVINTSSAAPTVSPAGSILLLVPNGLNHDISLSVTNTSNREMVILGQVPGASNISVLVIP